jgi:signal transduction histidine kinase
MPELDGFELAAMIREHPRFRKTAIIFISAIQVSDLDRLRGYEMGAVDYVPVPVVPEVLRAKVKVFAELYRKTRQLERLNAELERRVEERTAALAEVNMKLEQRVEERTREREAALAQVHEMQKLESLGQLTGGVAHDFNNLLMGIIGSLNYLAKKPPADPKAQHFLTAARESAERGAALTKRLLAFARRQELRPEPVDVQRLTEGMAEMLQRSIGPTIQVDMAFDRELALISVDPNQLELAILNLALNARDAMPTGGVLEVATGNVELTEQDGVRGTFDVRPGPYIQLLVTDTGCGMDAATLDRVFEPFFTTKPTGQGSGLGLSTVYGIVKQSGGYIWVQSSPGAGTTIRICLPRVEAQPVARRTRADAAPAGRGSETVLLVEDDDTVRALTRRVLDRQGYHVLEARNGAEALRIAGPKLHDIHLVISDVVMPELGGRQLVERLRRSGPGCPCC